MTTLDRILSKSAIRADVIRDRVTDRVAEVLGAKKRVKTREIWSVGDFPNPWKLDQAEIDALTSDRWFPSTEDFAAAIWNAGAKGKVYKIVDHTSAFINLIYGQPKGSITRLNFVTHGAASAIGLKGRIEDDGVYFDEELEASQLEGFRKDGWPVGNEKVPWAEVQARFAKDAVIVVYACKVALSEAFLQDLADIFGVTVQAFSTELHFTYEGEALSSGRIDRRQLKVNGVTDVTGLRPDVTKTPSVSPPP